MAFVDYERIREIIKVEVRNTMSALVINELNDYLAQLRSILKEEQRILQDELKVPIKRFEMLAVKFENLQERLDDIEDRYSQDFIELIDELSKKEAIIERKSRQLEKCRRDKK